MIRLLPALLLTGLLAACGQKGALYLPPAKPAPAPTAVPSAAPAPVTSTGTPAAPSPASP